MARTRTIESIEKDIQKVEENLEKAKNKVSELEADLEKLQNEKREYEMKTVMEALQGSSKSIQDVIDFIEGK